MYVPPSPAHAALLAQSASAPSTPTPGPGRNAFVLVNAIFPLVAGGTPSATGATLAAGSALESGIWQRADGTYSPSAADLVYTGAPLPSAVGTAASTCDDWGAATSTTAALGASAFADSTWWAHAATGNCGTTLAVYCLEQ